MCSNNISLQHPVYARSRMQQMLLPSVAVREEVRISASTDIDGRSAPNNKRTTPPHWSGGNITVLRSDHIVHHNTTQHNAFISPQVSSHLAAHHLRIGDSTTTKGITIEENRNDEKENSSERGKTNHKPHTEEPINIAL